MGPRPPSSDRAPTATGFERSAGPVPRTHANRARGIAGVPGHRAL